MTPSRFNKGFTLIELLVVIAIIGILSSVVLVSVSSARQKGRNSKRVQDIRQIQIAIESYFLDKNVYPGCPYAVQHVCSTTGYSGPMSGMEIVPNYIASVSNDPINTSTQYGYYYARRYKMTKVDNPAFCLQEFSGEFCYTGKNTDYILATRLEGIPTTFTGWNQGANGLNYIVGSR